MTGTTAEAAPPSEYQRRARIGQVATIVVMVVGIGLLAALSSLLSYRIGLAPEAEVLRRGEVTVLHCDPDPWSLGTVQRCTAQVERWEPESAWVRGRVEFTSAQQVVLISREPLTGRVAVESHRQSWRVSTGGSSTTSSTEQAEVVVPAGWPAAPGWVAVLVVVGCLVLPVLAGLGVGFVLHRWALAAFPARER